MATTVCLSKRSILKRFNWSLRETLESFDCNLWAYCGRITGTDGLLDDELPFCRISYRNGSSASSAIRTSDLEGFQLEVPIMKLIKYRKMAFSRTVYRLLEGIQWKPFQPASIQRHTVVICFQIFAHNRLRFKRS